MSSQRDKRQSDVRFRILRLLESNPQMSQRALSNELGISLGAVNSRLNTLVEKGQLKVRNFRNANKKLGYAYILTSKGAAEKAALKRRFLQRKIEEFEALRAEIESLQADIDVSVDRHGVARSQNGVKP